MRTTAAHRGKHLTGSEVVQRTDACPICLDRAPRPAVFRIQTAPDIDLLHCQRCRAYSASHMPRPDVLDAYYGQYYQDEKVNRVTFQDVEHFGGYLARQIDTAPMPPTIRIMDFGGGDGSVALVMARQLLARDQARRVRIMTVDYEPPRPTGDPRIDLFHSSPDEPIPEKFDIVLASAVLEHIPEVHEVFVRLLDSVAAGGYFYARTPYAVPLTKVFRNLDLTYPAHVHDMGCGFWNRLIELFRFDGRYVASRPSIVESRFRDDPVRALAAHVLKLPARIEGLISPAGRKDRFWTLVGGWEVLLQRSNA